MGVSMGVGMGVGVGVLYGRERNLEPDPFQQHHTVASTLQRFAVSP